MQFIIGNYGEQFKKLLDLKSKKLRTPEVFIKKNL